MPLRFKLEDLSQKQREQVMRELEPPKRTVRVSPTPTPTAEFSTTPKTETKARSNAADFVEAPAPTPKSVSAPTQKNLHDAKMSSTEKAYLRDVLRGNGWFEPITLKSPSNNRYTPDFLAFFDGVPTLIEVKGGYRLQSEGRAHTAFLEAVSNFSQIFQFLWVKRLKGGKWEQKLVFPKS